MDVPKLQERIAGSCNSSIDSKLQDKKFVNKKAKFDFVSCSDYLDLSRRKINDRTSLKSSDTANVSSSCNGHFSGFEPSTYTSDKPNINGLDSKSTKIRQIVEDAVSPESKQAVAHILEQVQRLNTSEKLLLYLQLPTGKPDDADPLRQPLNPLGSRFEIQQTITWIETHLEEDQEISLPKQDVYDEYIAYCNSNHMKPLSTADFGKVMKQVFPRVRPRRLGTRGNSRYCYSGLRKKIKLNVPLLPDLGVEPTPTGKQGSEDELSKCVSYLILEWAEKLLDTKFERLQDLAGHLVQKMCFDTFSGPALMLASVLGLAKPKNKGVSATDANKHRETQLQLQKKLQERFVMREQKRKLQNQQQVTGVGKGASEKAKSKRVKMSDGASNRERKVPDVSPCSLVPKVELELSSSSGSIICDKDKSIVPIAAVPSEQKVRSETSITDSSGSNCKLMSDRNSNDSLTTAQTDFPHQNVYKTSLCDSQSTDNKLTKHCKTVNKLTSGSDFLSTLDKKIHSADSTSSVNSLSIKRRKSSDECVINPVAGLCRQNSLNLCTNSLDSACKTQSCYSTSGNDHIKGRNSVTFPPVQEVNANTLSLSHSSEKCVQLHSKSPLLNNTNVDATKSAAVVNKLPIPRLSNPNKSKQLANVIIFPPATTATILQQSQSPHQFPQKKYKPIQPKPQEEVKKEVLETNGETVPGNRPDELATVVANCDKGSSVDKKESTNQYSTEISQESFSEATVKTAHAIEAVKNGTNEESIRCLENDALLTDYFHGGNNSQEQEEELVKYFQHQNSSSSNEEVEDVLRQNLQAPEELPNLASKCDQLSQLRLLLERNLKPIRSHSTSVHKCAESGRSKTSFSTPSSAVSVTLSSAGRASSAEGNNVPSSDTGNELEMMASKSLSLLSRRSQQHSRADRKPNLTLSSLVPASHSSSLATRRRVSFETSVMEHAVPQSPNTRSFTPISPGPYSPVTIHKNSKSCSANASPFVSPRNTPVLRSRHNCSQGISSQPCSYVASSNGSRCRQPVPAKIVRSNSVNSHNICTPYRLTRPQAMSANLPQRNTFAIPGSFPFESSGLKLNLSTSAKALPPMSPLSISAPQSPMLQYQNLSLGNCKSESDALTTYGDSLLKEAVKTGHVARNDDMGNCDGVPGAAHTASGYAVDPLAQEVSQIFRDASSDQKNIEALLAALPGSSQMLYRSQSVPLHRMMSDSALVSPQSTQPSPLYPEHQQAFTFNSLSSATSSVDPTPVPSEFMDFTSLGETEAENEETEGINTESLAQIFNILNSSTVQKAVDHASLTIGVEGNLENEGFAIHSQQRNSYSSRSYPNTPVPYKNSCNRDPLVSSFNLNLEDNFGVISRSYPSTPLLSCCSMNGDEIGPFQNAAENAASNLLNGQHEHEELITSSTRRNINIMSSFCVDELQLDSLDDFQSCDPLSELVQEVQDVGEQTDVD